MSAYMRRDIWQLHPVDVIVSADHMIETMLPVQCHKWHSIIIVKQESTIHSLLLSYLVKCCSRSNDKLDISSISVEILLMESFCAAIVSVIF